MARLLFFTSGSLFATSCIASRLLLTVTSKVIAHCIALMVLKFDGSKAEGACKNNL